jgi:hypothetical protein
MAAALTTVVVPARTTMVIGIANGTTMMADIIAEEPSSDRTDTAGKSCITQLGRAVGAHGITRSKMGSANRIVATETHLEIEAAEIGGL